MLRASATLAAACLAVGIAAAEAPTVDAPMVETPPALAAPAPRWYLRLPEPGALQFHGSVNFDGAGTGNAGILYPAPNVGGFLVAILAHGAMVSGMKSGQKTKLQEAADAVLAPYRATVDTLRADEVMRSALATVEVTALEPGAPTPGDGLVLESIPIVVMTQDRRALVVDNLVAVRDPKTPKKFLYQNMVRVVAAPKLDEDIDAAWNADDGAALREAVVGMYGRTLALALADVGVDPQASTVPFKTMRYVEGETERIERARPLQVECDRVLLRNLRGWLMSVPLRTDAARAECAAVPAAAPAAAPGSTASATPAG